MKQKLITFEMIETVAASYEFSITEKDIKALGFETIEDYVNMKHFNPWNDNFDIIINRQETIDAGIPYGIRIIDIK